ncbi:hypothetical protein BH11BAC7_BH11BAC7_05140 [soil metagenome]
MNLRIEAPCHEDWNAMTQHEKGRHCDSCCKTVFDFTNMPVEDVIQFISSNKKGSICGRFTDEQVAVPAAVKNKFTVSWNFKKFLAAVLLVFGGALFTGCANNETAGKLIMIDSQPVDKDLVAFTDTTIPVSRKDTIPQKTDTVKHEIKGMIKCEPKPKEQTYYKGDVMVERPGIVGLTVLENPLGDTLK